MKKTGLLILLIIITNQIFGYSILNRFSGDEVENIDARIAAMGGAGVAEGSLLFSAKLNPANLGFLDFNFGGQFVAGIMKNDDNRSLPMYNFFDGYIDDATYVSNVNYFDHYAVAVYYARDLNDFKLSGSLSYAPYKNFECYYVEEVRNDEGSDYDNYPPLIAKNYIDGSGAINSMSLTVAVTYLSKIALGFEVAKLTGDQTLSQKILWSDYANNTVNGLIDTKERTTRDYDEIGFKLGLNGRLNPRIQLGLTFMPKIEFDQNTKFAGNDTTLTYDSIITTASNWRFGVSYQPRNIMRTSFNVDIEVVNWSDVNDLYDTGINYYVGVEHSLKNKMPLRFGFRYNVDYRTLSEEDFIYSDKIISPTFSAGTGFIFMEKFQIDISGEYTYRKYEALDLFMDSHYNYSQLWNEIEPADRGWENPDQVSESFFNVITSISYKW